jgi:hypothetical protein
MGGAGKKRLEAWWEHQLSPRTLLEQLVFPEALAGERSVESPRREGHKTEQDAQRAGRVQIRKIERKRQI